MNNFCGFPPARGGVRVQDPHGELQGQNVLIVRYSSELTAAHFGIDVGQVTQLLASARAKMAEVREGRPRPHLDTKMLASWNGEEPIRESLGFMRLEMENQKVQPLAGSQCTQHTNSIHTARIYLIRANRLILPASTFSTLGYYNIKHTSCHSRTFIRWYSLVWAELNL